MGIYPLPANRKMTETSKFLVLVSRVNNVNNPCTELHGQASAALLVDCNYNLLAMDPTNTSIHSTLLLSEFVLSFKVLFAKQ